MMMRLRLHAIRLAVCIVAVAPTVLRAQDATRAVVVVLPFDNDAIGPNARDFDRLGKGVQDFLISDLASYRAIRLVDRSRIETVLREQAMVKPGQIDPAAAVRLGKILGAQYAVVGGFITDGNGNAVLTGRTIDIEKPQIANRPPDKVSGKSDDVLALVGQLSSRIAASLIVPVKPGTRGKLVRLPGHNPAPPGSGAAQPGDPSSSLGPVETFARPASATAMRTKLDVATVKLYSDALDDIDQRHPAKAAALLKQVLAKFPSFEPAQRQLDRLSNAGS